MKTKIKISNISKKRILTILICCLLGPNLVVNGQNIKHSLAGITTTMNFYSYIYRINDSTGIEIKYFIVEAPNGIIKTCFDACDICYQYHLGYTQLGTYTRCVNCGNTYPIKQNSKSSGSYVPLNSPRYCNISTPTLNINGNTNHFIFLSLNIKNAEVNAYVHKPSGNEK